MSSHAGSLTPALEPETETGSHLLPPYHVIIENDDFHSQDFVIEVLRKVFGFDSSKAFELMLHAHCNGEAVVWTGAKEVAELKFEQIISFHQHLITGKDLGPLSCRIEPAS